jgi:hypothetical protein
MMGAIQVMRYTAIICIKQFMAGSGIPQKLAMLIMSGIGMTVITTAAIA